MSLAQRERQAMVKSMRSAGPAAPTLCEGWTVKDLAAHIVIRERRPDAAPGIMGGPLAAYTERIRKGYTEKPFDELLEDIRTGPPVWWMGKGPDRLFNTSEMFVHHEDVRRGGNRWESRHLSDRDEASLWVIVRNVAPQTFRSAPVSVVLVTDMGKRLVAKKSGKRTVTITGAPSEILLLAFGRKAVNVTAEGDEADVAAVLGCDRSV
ncbi:TIGR03085 family metal-binding protein [Smaragdicoccus niigatensis]|uniref:TIGR03085 family metal-binding protein n=1 Tax=Smaragdicoccus niigatensis TaxID=359359 RepID=UPI00035CC635|nr:TIGR03085 family metal-binding protein [Smaragdicoccus niigatensis]